MPAGKKQFDIGRVFTLDLTLENTKSAEVLLKVLLKRWHSLHNFANFTPSISAGPSLAVRDPKFT